MTTVPPSRSDSHPAAHPVSQPALAGTDDDKIVIVRRSHDVEKDLPDWSSTAPSGRPWRLRAATGIFQRDQKTYDPSGLASFAAWDAAWAAVAVPSSYGSYTLRPERERASGRTALAAAFVPYVHELAEQHHLARNDALTGSPTPYNKRSAMEKQQGHDSRRYQRAIEGLLAETVERMVSAGLFDTVVEVLAQTTPASPEALVANPEHARPAERMAPPPGTPVPLWDKLPRQAVGLAVLKGALGYGEEQTVPVLLDRLARLTTGDAAEAFWQGWHRQLNEFPDLMDRTQEVELPDVLAKALTGLARRSALIAPTQAVIGRLATVQGLGASRSLLNWRSFGASVGARLKHYYPRFNEADETLFNLVPLPFWLGVRTEVQYASKTGRWISDRVMALVRTDPMGPAVEDLVINAWLTLDKKQIVALEADLPGISRAHLPVLKDKTALSTVRATYTDMVHPSSASHRWAIPVFRRAGAPVDSGSGFRKWVHEDPQRLVNTLLSLSSKLEADQLKKSFRETDGESPSPALRRRAPRRL